MPALSKGSLSLPPVPPPHVGLPEASCRLEQVGGQEEGFGAQRPLVPSPCGQSVRHRWAGEEEQERESY